MHRLAHGLARRGHSVHVVTNAAEAEQQVRIHMRPEDQERLGGHYGPGFVRVHHTVADPRGQWHVPWHNPYATKLAGLAIEVIRDHDVECVASWYLEPYAVAGHLAASFTGRPHVVKTAGSDAGRLWHQPGMRALFDEIFLAADVVIGGGGLTKSLVELGVPRARIMQNDAVYVPLEEFAPEGAKLDLAAYASASATAPAGSTIGVFGKLGRFKGIHPLVRATRLLLDQGIAVRLAAMVHGGASDEQAFEAVIDELDLRAHVVRVPFLPNWRVPEFLRACDVVCCLEQDFPIKAHAPVIALEVMATGTPTLLSREIAAKQPEYSRLAHGYNCWIARDTNDHFELAECLVRALAEPSRSELGPRGRLFAVHVQSQCRFPQAIESAIRRAIDTHAGAGASAVAAVKSEGLAGLLSVIRHELEGEAAARAIELTAAPDDSVEWYRAAGSALVAAGSRASGAEDLARLAVQLLSACREVPHDRDSSLYRLHPDCPPWGDEAILACRPSLVPQAQAELYAQDPLAALTGDPDTTAGGPKLLVVLPFERMQAIKLFSLDARAAAFVACDGRRSIADIAAQFDFTSSQAAVAQAEELFALGILALRPAAGGEPR